MEHQGSLDEKGNFEGVGMFLRDTGGICDLRWAPAIEDPCERCLFRVISYMRSKAVDDAMKVLVGAENDVRGHHERSQWE